MKGSKGQNSCDRLVEILRHLDGRGNFATYGTFPNVLPGLEVEGVGSIGLPLSTEQAISLRTQCEQAGFGKGEQTIVDTTVRRAWRIKPDRFQLINSQWSDAVSTITTNVQQALGLEGQQLSAHLYDLLLYEEGGFFRSHRDGEKVNGMVGTLVIVLPSQFTGGNLVIRHEGREQVVNFATPSAKFKIQYAAFYADCEHEVKPLTGGYRLCLVYNLTSRKRGMVSHAPRRLESINQASHALNEWNASGDGQKIAVTLEHQYTQGGISWDTLKGADATRASVLADAAKAAGCRAYLALLTFWQSGECEDGYDEHYSRRRRHQYDADAEPHKHKMSEVYDSSLSAEHWHDSHGGAASFGKIPIKSKEILPKGSLTAIDPEENFEGYTGNEGMTLERWYRRAAIVIWPESRHFDVLCTAGAKQAVPALLQLMEDAKTAGADQVQLLTEQCRQFAEKILKAWPEPEPDRFSDWSQAKDEGLHDPLRAIEFLDDSRLLRTYLRKTLAMDAALQPGKDLASIVAKHSWTPLKEDIGTLFSKTSVYTLARNVALLQILCSKGAKEKKASVREHALDVCHDIAQIVVQALIRIDKGPADPSAWRVRRDERVILTALVKSLLLLEDDAQLETLAAHVMELPNRYSLQQTLCPMLVETAGFYQLHKGSAAPPLLAWVRQCEDQLKMLTTHPPQPPSDFRREAKVSCKCADCAELNRFLLDPDEGEHRFQMPQRRRDHLVDQIRHYGCDLDSTTDRRPRPQMLVCTKNAATYQRLLSEYQSNLSHLSALRRLP